MIDIDPSTEVHVVAARRTPMGKLGGALAAIRPDDLVAGLLREVVSDLEIVEQVDEVVLGAANQAGEDNRNVARMALLLAGLPESVPGVTVNRLCGSGLEAVLQGSRMIRLGEAHVVVTGGVDSMSRAPWVMEKSVRAFATRAPRVFNTALGWRFDNPAMARRFPLESMGETAENVASRFGISRSDQDAFALRSHECAAAAWDAGHFDDEVSPLLVDGTKGKSVRVASDEGVRRDTSMGALARLPTVFRRESGTVTAANASPLSDGAALLVLASGAWVRERGARSLGVLRSHGVAGVDPRFMGMGPVPATRQCLQRGGVQEGDVSTWEFNEAFAAQTLACLSELGLDPSEVNRQGGALALGHPIGASGARVLVTLVHRMARESGALGLAALCVGVGQGMACLVERA